jgi:hypothetical protein
MGVLILAALGGSACTTSAPAPVIVDGGQDVVAAQNRINRYFHSEVVHKLKPCWELVQGKGTVDFEYTYKRNGEAWEFETLAVSESTLDSGYADAARQCMQDAARGTSFPRGESDGPADEFMLDWRWPVPWPTDEDVSAIAMMAGRAGLEWGDCGLGVRAKCKDCQYDAGTKKMTCKTVCIGYKNCVLNQDGNGCSLSPKDVACSSGFGLGNAGGAVIY